MSKTVYDYGYNYNTLLITKSKVKDYIHDNGLECASETFDALHSTLETLLQNSIERAKRNARKRVLARDI